MIRHSTLVVLLGIVSSSLQQTTPESPCPNVFSYEPPGSESGRWYGVVNLSTDSVLHSLWLNIVLDSKADILGNWIGDVTTTDNIDFKIENTQMKISPGPSTAVRFFVQYNLLNRIPRIKAIRLNGREICNTRIPVVESIDSGTRSTTARPIRTETKPQNTRPVRPVDRPEERPVTNRVYGSQSGSSSSFMPTEVPSIGQGNANPYSISNGQVIDQSTGVRRPDSGYRVTTTSRTTTTRRYVEEDFPDIDRKPDPDDYFGGGLPVVTTGGINRNPVSSSNSGFYEQENGGRQGTCGKVVKNANPNPLVVNGRPTLEGQWPWQIALYQFQSVDSKYICGGTLVSHKHVITAAHCVTRKGSSTVVNKDTLNVILGKHNLRTSTNGVQVKFVEDIRAHPRYNASSFSCDLAILELKEPPVEYSDWVRPACLWPESQLDLSNVVGKKGSVVGWGFDQDGRATEELTLAEMPVVDQETCIRSYSDFFARFTSDYTYCAGFKNGVVNKTTGTRQRTSVCNGDSGGGMVFNMQGTWYLRGLVSLSVAKQNEYQRCDPSHYVVFTDLAKFLPWIRENVNDY